MFKFDKISTTNSEITIQIQSSNKDLRDQCVIFEFISEKIDIVKGYETLVFSMMQ